MSTISPQQAIAAKALLVMKDDSSRRTISARRPSTTSDETNIRSQTESLSAPIQARQHPSARSRISIQWLPVLVRRTMSSYQVSRRYSRPPRIPRLKFLLYSATSGLRTEPVPFQKTQCPEPGISFSEFLSSVFTQVPHGDWWLQIISDFMQ